jgi:hypothetical protein
MSSSIKSLLESAGQGTPVTVKVDGEEVQATYDSWSDRYNMPVVYVGAKRLYRKIISVDGMRASQQRSARKDHGLEVKQSRFDVNTRFDFIEAVVDMVVTGESKSVIITGSGGLGKSYTVFKRLTAAGLDNVDDVEGAEELQELGMEIPGHFKVVKGFTTPKSLYRLLWNCKDKIIIFDDCDSVWDNPTTVSILKGALDSYDTRRISWLTELARKDDDLPMSFEFKGKIIFVSNLSLAELDQAVISRCLFVDVSMTPQEKIDRIKQISGAIRPDIAPDDKTAALDLIDKHKENIGDLNIRTFLKVLEIQHANPENWQELAEYVVTAF